MFNPSARTTVMGLCLFIAAGCGDDSPQLKPVDVSSLPTDAAKNKPKTGAAIATKKLGGKLSD